MYLTNIHDYTDINNCSVTNITYYFVLSYHKLSAAPF